MMIEQGTCWWCPMCAATESIIDEDNFVIPESPEAPLADERGMTLTERIIKAHGIARINSQLQDVKFVVSEQSLRVRNRGGGMVVLFNFDGIEDGGVVATRISQQLADALDTQIKANEALMQRIIEGDEEVADPAPEEEENPFGVLLEDPDRVMENVTKAVEQVKDIGRQVRDQVREQWMKWNMPNSGCGGCCEKKQERREEEQDE